MRKLHIPAYVDVSPECRALWECAHIDSLCATNFVQWDLVNSGVDYYLFRLLRPSPQATEQECLICFCACTVFMDIHKIRGVRYNRERERDVDAALFVTRKNIRNETGYLATALFEEITKLRAYCETGSASSSLRQVLRRWRSWTG
jgi:hypothetical protein